MALAREWDELVEQARALPGMRNFLRSARIERLLPAAMGGPIVVTNVSGARSDALLITESGTDSCPLTALTVDAAAERLAHYLYRLRGLDAAAQAFAAATAAATAESTRANAVAARAAMRRLAEAEAATDEMLTLLCEWLWEVCAAPILERLSWRPQPEGQHGRRLWWCPTGPLTLLPLHAAGYCAGTDSVLDTCVSSYTPTLQALLDARATIATERSGQRVLSVTATEVAGQPRLAAAGAPALRRLIPAERITAVDNPAATRSRVLSELVRHQVAHFDCHGYQNLDDPSSGGLVLADGAVTILDFAAGAWHGDFAGLAACQTAVGGIDLLDEAITLTAALHYTGYRHVVGTLWSVRDDITKAVFDALYESIVIDGTVHADSSATALHAVVRQQRAVHPTAPRLWAPFIHVGP